MKRFALVLASVLCIGRPTAADTVRLFSYDPADDATRSATGPVTVQFRQGLLHATVTNLRSTEAEVTIELSRVPDNSVGPGGLVGVLGKAEAWRELYRVSGKREGGAMLKALCQASAGWLAMGRPRYGSDLAIFVIAPGPNGSPRLCRTLNFDFKGEWRVPKSGTFDQRLLDHTREGPLG